MVGVRIASHAPGERSVSVTKGGRTETANWSHSAPDGGGSEPPPGSALTGNERVQINVNRTSGVNPAGFYFEFIATGFNIPGQYALAYPAEAAYHELDYITDFGDPDSLITMLDDDLPWERVYENGSGDRIILQGDLRDDDGNALATDGEGKPAVPAGYSFIGYSANRAYGPHCAHAYFITPEEFAAEAINGKVTRTVTVLVRSRAMVLAGDAPIQESIEVEIEDEESYFGDANTCYVSNASVFPAGATHTVNTWAEAILEMRDSVKPRILFREGEAHDNSHPAPGNFNSGGWRTDAYYDAMHFGTYGEGAGAGTMPIMLHGSNNMATRAKEGGDTAMWGLDFQGPYDSTRPYDMEGWENGERAISIDSGTSYSTTCRCRAEGWQRSFAAGAGSKNIVVQNCYGGNWWDYCFYANTKLGFASFIGVAFKQPHGTISASGKQNMYPNHGPWRCSAVEDACYLALCDFRTLNSHSGALQPTVRFGGNGSTEEDLMAEGNFDRLVLENQQGLGSGVYKGTARPKRQVYDKIVQIQMQTGNGFLSSWNASGITLRNTIHVIPNQPRLSGGVSSITGSNGNDDEIAQSLYDHPVKVYSNSILDFRDNANFAGSSWQTVKHSGDKFRPENGDPYASEFIVGNLLVYTPNRPGTTGYTVEDGPLDETMMLSERGMPGLYFEPNPGTATEAPPIDASFARGSEEFVVGRPLDGSAAIGDADPGEAPIPVRDLFGRPRPANASRGAVEPLA